MNWMKFYCIFFFFFIGINKFLLSQCVTPINTFPYLQDFETNNGNWISGGTNSDWAYGTPSKTVISNAASGTKCWIVGGLTGNSYNNGENSWIQSPCFDFTNLTNPLLTFKVFWETEKKYDGASFKYSIDGGNTWLTLGSINSNNGCLGSNWFNTNSITTLSTDGWSGNIQATSPCPNGAGNGSGGWLSAKHSLVNVAGQSSVQFRFTFAAGTQCNAYDGFAIDDFKIEQLNSTTNTVDYNYTCLNNYRVDFTNNSSLCATGFLWNFNDPVTGIDSISILENPTHIFSNPGMYQVKLTVIYPANILVSKTKTITIIDVNTTINSTIKCNGDSTGSITALAYGANGGYVFNWATTPIQNTATINNLKAGTYTIEVTGTNMCSVSKNVILNQPQLFTTSVQTSPNICNNLNGQILLQVSGGTMPYKYLWSNGDTVNPLKNRPSGTYNVQIKDSNNCTLNIANIKLKDSAKIFTINLGKDTAICPGNQIILNPGNFKTYNWQDNSANPTFTAIQTGKYNVTVVDNDGCSAFDEIEITVDCTDIFFPTAFSPNNDSKNDYFGALGNVFSVTNYQLTIYNRNGELIFSTSNPLAKWDGKIKGKAVDTGVYIWYSNYSINNQPSQMQKGTLTLIR